ncbi:hypothetical protein SAMN05421850_103121 [Lutimaribacter saemankumensis]|uniref:Uncharacterized protein n=2 Tax=Lutimaribacter saemankumensis TaxID=490829 RepID=A0A1G8L0D5_9RHOB|nr:hypothetical protein SAMN05421850_103121 [Lutimaribacter saemankumensis]
MAVSSNLMILLMALTVFLTIEPREVPASPSIWALYSPDDLCLTDEADMPEMSMMSMPVN